MNKELMQLTEILKVNLPGVKAQNFMLPESRKNQKTATTHLTKQSSVLISLFLRDHKYHTLLFQRPEYDGRHGGQVCFPGGKKEAQDPDLKATALREAQEEVGIIPEETIVLGKLTPLHISVSDYHVQPYVGYLNYSPSFVPEKSEVAALIEVPLESLLNEKNRKEKNMMFNGIQFSVPYFDIKNYFVWGATAMIINEFITLLRSISFPLSDSYSAGSAR